MITQGYVRCRQRKLPLIPSHEGKLSHPDDSENDPCGDIRATSMYGRWSMGLEVEIWRWDHVGCFYDSLFSSPLLWISAQYKWRRHGFYHLRNSVNGRWIFPVRLIRRKAAFELYRSVVGLMGSYNCVPRMIVSFLVSLSFSSFILALAAQAVCA
jgi:hypothetical protein